MKLLRRIDAVVLSHDLKMLVSTINAKSLARLSTDVALSITFNTKL